MKKISFLAVLLACLATTAIAQIPDNVQTYFKYQKPGVRMEMVKHSDNGYVASFSKEGENGTAYFDGDGIWLKTEVYIKGKNVPDAIKDGIENGKYSGCTIEEAKLTETPTSKVYTVSVYGDDNVTGINQYHDLYCTSSGNCWDK